jgi:mRNA interferase MazF
MVTGRPVSAGAGIMRGDVWLAGLDPTIGSEIRKTRPCLIISPPEIHDFLRTVIVAPMTTRGRVAPYRIPVTFAGRSGLILLDQVRTIDKERLIRRLSSISRDTLATTLARLRELFEE